MRRAAPVSRQPPFAWSAAGSAADEASIAYIDLSDNAPFCGLPTSLLNHETSVTSFRAVEPRTFPAGLVGAIGEARWALQWKMNHSALHNKSCIDFFRCQNPGLPASLAPVFHSLEISGNPRPREQLRARPAHSWGIGQLLRSQSDRARTPSHPAPVTGPVVSPQLPLRQTAGHRSSAGRSHSK